MLRRFSVMAALVVCVAVGALVAAPQVTIVLKNGQRHSGTLAYHHDNNMGLVENGKEVSFPQSDIAVIEFAGDPTPQEISKLSTNPNPSELQRNTIVLRDGKMINGKLHDISSDGNTITINAEQGGQRQSFSADQVARIYMSPASAATALNINPSGQQQPGPVATTGQQSKTVVVPANQGWTDTGMNVTQGQRISIQATGQIRWSANPTDTASPDGSPGVNQADRRTYPVPTMGVGGLIGRVGNARPFPIGSNNSSVVMPQAGQLYIGINDSHVQDNSGSYSVTITPQ
jgi:small nuclear ribonucleoprotein (snRNP)-like protein